MIIGVLGGALRQAQRPVGSAVSAAVLFRCLEAMAAYALRAPCPGEWPP